MRMLAGLDGSARWRRTLMALHRVLGGCSRAGTLALAIAAMVLIGLADYVTGLEVSALVFYLAPVCLGAWYGAMPTT